MNTTLKLFKKDIIPDIRKNRLNFVIHNFEPYIGEIEDISEKTNRIFSYDEKIELKDYFETTAKRRGERDFSVLITLVVIFSIFVLIENLAGERIPYLGGGLIVCLILWLLFVRFLRSRDYLNFASLNIVRHSLGMSLVRWNDYTEIKE